MRSARGLLTRGVAALTLVTILAGACGNDTLAAKDKSPGMSKTASSVADSRSTEIPQPTAAQLAAAGFEKRPVAAEGERVDARRADERCSRGPRRSDRSPRSGGGRAGGAWRRLPCLDLQLRYLAPAETDLARFDVWARGVLVDAASGDMSGVSGDLTRIDAHLEALRTTVDNEDLAAATDEAQHLRDTLGQVQE
jgi:hypothetical protein